jgi:hypothetical protein
VSEKPPCRVEAGDTGPLGSRWRLSRLAHIAFWTALFYLLAYGVAKLSEWLSEM